MNQVFLVKVLFVLSGLGAAFALSLIFMVPPAAIESRPHDASVTERRLVAELEALRAAWDERHRHRILELAPDFAARYRGALNRLLRMEGHRLLGEAAEYAGATGLVELREPLVKLVRARTSLAPEARIKAMLAADRLAPWTREQLSEFLTKGKLTVKLGALRICEERPQDVPWNEVLAILNTTAEDSDQDSGRELRDAAVRAIPQEPDPFLRRELWNMVSFGEGMVALVGLRALARTSYRQEIVEKILFHMDQFDEHAVLAALHLLGQWGRRLPDRKSVWAIASRDDRSMATRAMAIYCLELTRSFDTAELREFSEVAPPLLRYFASRCILSTGHADGARGLLDIIDSEPGPAQRLSCDLFAWMTGKSTNQTREGLEAGLVRGLASLRGRRLPTPGFDFGDSGPNGEAAVPAK